MEEEEENREWVPPFTAPDCYYMDDDEDEESSPYGAFTDNNGWSRRRSSQIISFRPPDPRRGVPEWADYIERRVLSQTLGYWEGSSDRDERWVCAALARNRLCIVELSFYAVQLPPLHHERLVMEMVCLGCLEEGGERPFERMVFAAEHAGYLWSEMRRNQVELSSIPPEGSTIVPEGGFFDTFHALVRHGEPPSEGAYYEGHGWLGLAQSLEYQNGRYVWYHVTLSKTGRRTEVALWRFDTRRQRLVRYDDGRPSVRYYAGITGVGMSEQQKQQAMVYDVCRYVADEMRLFMLPPRRCE